MAHSTFPASYVSGSAGSSAPAVSSDPEAAGRCPACPHALVDHDPVSLRFCRATPAGTVAGATARGCICRS